MMMKHESVKLKSAPKGFDFIKSIMIFFEKKSSENKSYVLYDIVLKMLVSSRKVDAAEGKIDILNSIHNMFNDQLV